MSVPVAQVQLSARFGDRGEHWKHRHTGLDFVAQRGTPVTAALAGRVVYSRLAGLFGKTIVIQHGQHIETLYAHLAARAVKNGDHVVAGQFIGLVGTTGNSTGPHLHFEVRVNGKPHNPSLFLWGENR